MRIRFEKEKGWEEKNVCNPMKEQRLVLKKTPRAGGLGLNSTQVAAPIPIIKEKRGPFQNSNESVWGDRNQNVQKCLGPLRVSNI